MKEETKEVETLMEEQIVKKEKEILIFNIIVRFAVFFVVLIFFIISFNKMEYKEIIINMILLCMALIMAFHGVRNYIQYHFATKIWKELDKEFDVIKNFKNRQ